MNDTEYAIELFIKLVNFSLNEDNFDEKRLIAEELLICGMNYEDSLDTLLSEFIKTPNIVLFKKLRHYIISSSQWLTASQILKLVATLVLKKEMPLQETASLLSNFSIDQKASLTEEELSVVELAELVYEDFCEGFVDVEDDDIFFNKLLYFFKKSEDSGAD